MLYSNKFKNKARDCVNSWKPQFHNINCRQPCNSCKIYKLW